MATCTPSSASRLANACPMPLAAPVMTATLSLCPLAMCSLFDAHSALILRSGRSRVSKDGPLGRVTVADHI